MPEDIPGGDMSACIDHFQAEEDMDEESAARLCQSLREEAKADNGDPDALLEAIRNGAGLIADVAVDFNSAVDVPAIDSKWVMMKSDGSEYDHKVTAPTVFKQDGDTEKRISYAPAMIPREPDKEGDVVPTATVERAAHGYLENDGEVDTDHSLVDGKGTVVESWIEPTEREWDLPDGGTETYPAGTWMVGIKWESEPWERIKAGDLTGLSIYGQAEHVELSRAATAKELDIPLAEEAVVHLVYESETAAEKASEEIGLDGDTHEHEFDGMTVFMPGATHEAFVERYMELAEEDGEIESALTATKDESPDTHKGDGSESGGMAPDSAGEGGGTDADADTGDSTDDGPTLKDLREDITTLAEDFETVKDAVETEKQDAQDAAAILAEEFGLDGPDAVIDAVQAKADGEYDDDEEDEDEAEKAAETESAEKRAADANLAKGTDGTATAQKGVTGDGEATSGAPSFSDVIAKADAED